MVAEPTGNQSAGWEAVTPSTKERGPKEVRVWDPFVRVAHWLLAAAFFIAYLTDGKPQWLHVWSGYLVAAIIVSRIVWGLVGPRHARFAEFVPSPRAALRYLIDLVRLRAPRHLGHSPAGGAMIVALILSLSITAGTGMALLAIRENQGPLAPWLGGQVVAAAPTPSKPGERKPKPGRMVKQVHELFSNLTLLLVGFHVAGVAGASFAHRENLVRAMITGRKRAPDSPARQAPAE
ncbi:MAG: cytochrome b/b6 domain-containing protein [Alphaproteobacteria bacterium]|nr:cytochrome b/b6 domain-containing protein [Alphaproteobacteria bacterium]